MANGDVTKPVFFSAQPCGCDLGANHACERHLLEYAQYLEPKASPSSTAAIVTTVSKSEEVRIVDPVTGGEKGQKLARFSLIPVDFLWGLAEHYGRGARKYDDRNWERGYRWSLSLDALDRHKSQWLAGEDDDPDTGSHHLLAVAFHTIALWWFSKHGRGTDDIRIKSGV